MLAPTRHPTLQFHGPQRIHERFEPVPNFCRVFFIKGIGIVTIERQVKDYSSIL